MANLLSLFDGSNDVKPDDSFDGSNDGFLVGKYKIGIGFWNYIIQKKMIEIVITIFDT